MKRIALLLILFLFIGVASAQLVPTFTLQNAQSVNANGSVLQLFSHSSVVLQITISGIITVNFEVSLNGTDYFIILCNNISTNVSIATVTASTLVSCNVAGLSFIRARTSGATGSPSATVSGAAFK